MIRKKRVPAKKDPSTFVKAEPGRGALMAQPVGSPDDDRVRATTKRAPAQPAPKSDARKRTAATATVAQKAVKVARPKTT